MWVKTVVLISPDSVEKAKPLFWGGLENQTNLVAVDHGKPFNSTPPFSIAIFQPCKLLSYFLHSPSFH